ncbi:hypothetical protein DCS_00535 [Drechmeria coniospora]|uniref:Uncharacterized protein n=1 Tax=Drechmeria coniospora TaxID=98403 RepID=A0A151GQL2_DRECN|nr:hypothetical protein DCS_00535 [Drechmeria coniospora]KYK59405.1 hypothetical protein DCS_00535 [Drechmeria coniospora]ODA76352.1 hypothetical protein RJ55_08198 [Drechmeria coniospora]
MKFTNALLQATIGSASVLVQHDAPAFDPTLALPNSVNRLGAQVLRESFDPNGTSLHHGTQDVGEAIGDCYTKLDQLQDLELGPLLRHLGETKQAFGSLQAALRSKKQLFAESGPEACLSVENELWPVFAAYRVIARVMVAKTAGKSETEKALLPILEILHRIPEDFSEDSCAETERRGPVGVE